jgi:hypothetical protein
MLRQVTVHSGAAEPYFPGLSGGTDYAGTGAVVKAGPLALFLSPQLAISARLWAMAVSCENLFTGNARRTWHNLRWPRWYGLLALP